MSTKQSLISKARDEAELLLSRLDMKRIPTGLPKVARKLDIIVEYTPLDRELSGMAMIKDEQKLVWINSLHHPNRQRFTLAHEIGHHVLHEDILREGVHVDKGILRRDTVSSAGTEVKEIQANAFASQLLMPKAEITRLSQDLDLDDEESIKSLAKKFRVSVAAIQYRLVRT